MLGEARTRSLGLPLPGPPAHPSVGVGTAPELAASRREDSPKAVSPGLLGGVHHSNSRTAATWMTSLAPSHRFDGRAGRQRGACSTCTARPRCGHRGGRRTASSGRQVSGPAPVRSRTHTTVAQPEPGHSRMRAGQRRCITTDRRRPTAWGSARAPRSWHLASSRQPHDRLGTRACTSAHSPAETREPDPLPRTPVLR